MLARQFSIGGQAPGGKRGAGASYGIRRSTWDPGLSTTSRIPCGIQCGIMGFNVGSRTSNVIPTSVRDPTREHRCRAGPGLPCGRQSGILDPVRDPESRIYVRRVSFGAVPHSISAPKSRGPLGGVPPSLDIPAPRSSGMPRNLL